LSFRVFQYGLPAPEELDDLNRFLGSHRIVSVRNEIVERSGGALLVFVVEYVDGASSAKGGRATSIDYREVLSAEEYEVYNELRTIRKERAEEEAVPVYNLFNNAQLAAMIQQRISEVSDLAAIPGVGKAKIEKYGPLFVERVRELWAKSKDTEDPEQA
jgi:superfamily II DNA helicase RecQ